MASPLASFAAGIRADRGAVAAATAERWSNGQTEGQITRLKLVKRQIPTGSSISGPASRAGLSSRDPVESSTSLLRCWPASKGGLSPLDNVVLSPAATSQHQQVELVAPVLPV